MSQQRGRQDARGQENNHSYQEQLQPRGVPQNYLAATFHQQGDRQEISRAQQGHQEYAGASYYQHEPEYPQNLPPLLKVNSHDRYQQHQYCDPPQLQRGHSDSQYNSSGYSGEYNDQQQYYDPYYYGYYDQQQYDGYYDEQHQEYANYDEQHQEYANYDEADLSNLDEIDQVLASLDIEGDNYNDGIEGISYGDGNEHTGRIQDDHTPYNALPSVNGVLTSQASQFWFPECRDCSCCQGFKHGCKCCRAGVQVCSCVSQKPASSEGTASLPTPPINQPENISQKPASSEGTVSLPTPPINQTENTMPPAALLAEPPSASPPTIPPSSTGGTPTAVQAAAPVPRKLVVEAPPPAAPSTLPPGVASHGPGPRAEYWFPECRECRCCEGFKHGCKCCQGGSSVCSCVGPEASSKSSSARDCSFFKAGTCKNGDRCKFRHS